MFVMQLPGLDSHVLLVELVLDNNNLSDISSITSAWLPRLRTLYLSNNWCVVMNSHKETHQPLALILSFHM